MVFGVDLKQLFVTTVLTMIAIYLIKMAAAKTGVDNLPVVGDIVHSV